MRITLKLRKEVDVKNDKKIVGEFIDFIETEEVTLNDKIQNLKNKQEKEKLDIYILDEDTQNRGEKTRQSHKIAKRFPV